MDIAQIQAGQLARESTDGRRHHRYSPIDWDIGVPRPLFAVRPGPPVGSTRIPTTCRQTAERFVVNALMDHYHFDRHHAGAQLGRRSDDTIDLSPIAEPAHQCSTCVLAPLMMGSGSWRSVSGSMGRRDASSEAAASINRSAT